MTPPALHPTLVWLAPTRFQGNIHPAWLLVHPQHMGPAVLTAPIAPPCSGDACPPVGPPWLRSEAVACVLWLRLGIPRTERQHTVPQPASWSSQGHGVGGEAWAAASSPLRFFPLVQVAGCWALLGLRSRLWLAGAGAASGLCLVVPPRVRS